MPTARPSATCSTRSPRPTRASARRSAGCCSSSRTSPSSTTASIQLILREADQKDLALALRGVADEVKDRILVQHVRARRPDARRGDAVPAAAAQARHRGGPGPGRRDRAQARGGRRGRPVAHARKTLSSESAAATVAAYTFRQLEAARRIGQPMSPTSSSAAHAEAEQHPPAGVGRRRGRGPRRRRRRRARARCAPTIQALRRRRRSARRRCATRPSASSRRDAVDLAAASSPSRSSPARSPSRRSASSTSRAVALRRIRDRQHVTLVVNPDDLDARLRSRSSPCRPSSAGSSSSTSRPIAASGAAASLARTDEGEIDAASRPSSSRAREIVDRRARRPKDPDEH